MMNKYRVLFLWLITVLHYTEISALSEDPYYQDVYEKYIISVNAGIQASVRFDDYGCNLQVYPSIPINLDIFYRFTSANVFGYSGVLVEVPFLILIFQRTFMDLFLLD